MLMATLEERKAEYDTHKTNGLDFYNSFRSQLTLDVESGTKTLEGALAIQDRLLRVGECLCSGDWKSAYNVLDNTLGNQHCTKEIIDNMKTDILTYIQTNYTW